MSIVRRNQIVTPPEPRWLPNPLDHAPLVVEPLGPETCAQIVRAYGRVEVQVSASLPAALRAEVYRHTIEDHPSICKAASCTEARRWLGERPAPLRLLTARTA